MFGYRKWRTKRLLLTILQEGGAPRTPVEIHRTLIHRLKGRALSRHPTLEWLIGAWDDEKMCVYGLPTFDDTQKLCDELFKEKRNLAPASRPPLKLATS